MRLLDLRGMGLAEILRCAAKDFMADEMPTYASALAFQMLFSLFPFLLFLIALIGFLDLQQFFDWLQQQAALLLPAQAMDTVNAVIAQFQTERVGLFSVGILAALWTASAGVRSTMLAMNKAYDVKEGRPAWKRIPLSVFYTIGIALMLLSAAALMLVGPQVMGWLAGWVGLEQLIVILWTWLRWPLAVLLLILVVATIYYVAPDVEQRFHFITPGSVLAVLVWIAASLGFGFYVRNFANYDATYGSVGAIIVMLLYFFISAAVLLFGAEMNAVIEHRHPEGKDPGEKQL
ncbi:YihY/virulence factor BrkB family protein [Azotobacter chroococcum]|jgi:membrane protein|uniref:Inner membrane protein YihY n=2 Tax=Azotobacter chroococcum TaxID=353 RepID=A0A0C4WLK2_9GAMM|nr:YihY/virulence factor BrkB family protein [Azotobacter chroococcum]AJE21101.1 Inner membrane protein YihY [Azotobacter chroococcum NCIMB 8003]ASL27028.1 ribonuclease BN [Azotobacter chroococcum]QQE87346.1 YihY/virulence factor BrkB family protein [Azotobacter chroococcum]TBW11041.1 YihY/virulence factor BrkB family protein [Azotobacter chroococcum]TBW37496.1 YihY/virulence factor BrkB family protein [Azotobacter chroococcum]